MDNTDNKNTNKTDEVFTSDIISDILVKYGLKENEEELAKKYFGKAEDSNGAIVFWVATKLNNKEKTETDSIAIVADKLRISQEISKQIIEDIKKNLLPVLMRKNSTQKNIAPAPLPKELKSIPKKIPEPSQKNKINKKLPPIKHKEKMPDIQQNNNIIKRGSDAYREPVE